MKKLLKYAVLAGVARYAYLKYKGATSEQTAKE